MHIDISQADTIQAILDEIGSDGEKSRRAKSLVRHQMYKDAGKEFLIEQIRREFGEDAMKEMRLAPINFLKKIVNKRGGGFYKKSPIRIATKESDQKLMDHYVSKLGVNQLFLKAHKYFVLDSNTVIYVTPCAKNEGGLKARVIPSYMYSKVANPYDQTEVEAFVFSAFTDASMFMRSSSQPAATGVTGYSKEPGVKRSNDLVASGEKDSEEAKMFVWWSQQNHFTTNGKGQRIQMGENETGLNELGLMPVIELTKDRDNTAWAVQGEDQIDLNMALQCGWSDLLTIAKHQGFGQLTITGEEAPKNMVLGLNKAVFLKVKPGSNVVPTLDYKSSSANLSEQKEILMELLSLYLSTNDMNPKTIAGSMTSQNFTSGFHALIESADQLEALEQDKPALFAAEKSFWKVIKAYHNTLADREVGPGGLTEESKKLGKFSDEFDPEIIYSEAKPLESDQDRLAYVEKMIGLGLMTREGAMKKMFPELNDKQIQENLAKVEEEKKANVEAFNQALGEPVKGESAQEPIDG